MSTSFPPPFYRHRPHPWHGLDAGPNDPAVVIAYIEITQFDVPDIRYSDHRPLICDFQMRPQAS